MPKTKTIDFQRVTFSFPKEVLLSLREKVAKNQMSAYIADLVKKDLENKESLALDLEEKLANFREDLPKYESSLKLLRKLRYD